MLFSKQDFPSAHSRPHHTPRLLHNSTNDVPYFASKQTGLIKTAHACKTTMWSQPTWPHRLRMISDSICQCCHEIFLLFMQQRNRWNNSVQINGYRKKKRSKIFSLEELREARTRCGHLRDVVRHEFKGSLEQWPYSLILCAVWYP